MSFDNDQTQCEKRTDCVYIMEYGFCDPGQGPLDGGDNQVPLGLNEHCYEFEGDQTQCEKRVGCLYDVIFLNCFNEQVLLNNANYYPKE